MTGRRIREAGDSALVLEFERSIDRRVNAQAIGVARAVSRLRIAGVRDVVPTFRSVAVYFDPLSGCTSDVRAALEGAGVEQVEESAGDLVEVPVAYGGETGPDLDAVASHAGTGASTVIDRHASVEYRAYMLGFLPGFAYLAHVDSRIAMPRRSTPRVEVPAGSVGIAGVQTGVYPCASPGGWQIIGRALESVFDARRTPPALIAPGDRVRFIPVPGERHASWDVTQTERSSSEADLSRMSVDAELDARAPGGRHAVTVIKPGLFTTIQDQGRWGHQHLGVPVSGAMDVHSHRVANGLVGNDAAAPALEVTVVGPDLRLEEDLVLAIAGADLDATLDGARIPRHAPVRASAGRVLRFGQRRSGGRAYVAFEGGIDVPMVLGSASTHTRTHMGGFEGRAIRAGDRLALGSRHSRTPVAHRAPTPSGGARLRVLTGPQHDFFPPSGLEVLLSTRFVVAPDSDRMGYRLVGPRAIPRLSDREMISDATFTGGVQVPPSGNPIVLMADRPTTGGYPQIVVVITADIPFAGQLVPGDWIEFELCSMSDALQALAAQGGTAGASRQH